MSQSGAVVREISQKEDKCGRKYMIVREVSQREDKHEIQIHGCERNESEGR